MAQGIYLLTGDKDCFKGCRSTAPYVLGAILVVDRRLYNPRTTAKLWVKVNIQLVASFTIAAGLSHIRSSERRL